MQSLATRYYTVTMVIKKRNWTTFFVVFIGIVSLIINIYNIHHNNSNNNNNKNNNVPSQQQPNERPQQCTQAQLQKGQWIKTNETVPINEQETCKNVDYLTGGYSTNYEWEPQDDYNRTCEFGKWDANAFCSLVKGATIMIVGDSLSFEHYVNMMSSLGRHSSTLLQFRSLQRKMTLVQDVCSSSNDRQTTTTTQTQPAAAAYVTYRRDDNLKNLASILEEKFPIILILNRGAHYVQDDELLSDLQDTFLHVQNWQTKCKQQYGIKCHFFWRTTVPGHPGCQTFTEPVNNITQMEELVRTKSIVGGGRSTTKYHWAEFQGQNILVLNELQKWSSRIDYQVIDAYSVNILRPDQHRTPGKDCLHSCDSGKIQVYNRLMLHYLSGSRTLKDIQILQDFQHPWNRTTNIQPNGTDIIYAMAPPL